MTFDDASFTLPPQGGEASEAMVPVTRAEMAAFVEYALVEPSLTAVEVAEGVLQAEQWGVSTVWVVPSRLPVSGEGLQVSTVVGSVSGTDNALVKAFAGRIAVDQGASEVAIVLDVGAIAAGEWNAVMGEVVTVREACPAPVRLQVVVDVGAVAGMPQGVERVERCCRLAVAAGADTVCCAGTKGEVGADPDVCVEQVALLADCVDGQAEVAVVGVVKSAEVGLRLLAAGASRIITPFPQVVLEGMPV